MSAQSTCAGKPAPVLRMRAQIDVDAGVHAARRAAATGTKSCVRSSANASRSVGAGAWCASGSRRGPSPRPGPHRRGPSRARCRPAASRPPNRPRYRNARRGTRPLRSGRSPPRRGARRTGRSRRRWRPRDGRRRHWTAGQPSTTSAAPAPSPCPTAPKTARARRFRVARPAWPPAGSPAASPAASAACAAARRWPAHSPPGHPRSAGSTPMVPRSLDSSRAQNAPRPTPKMKIRSPGSQPSIRNEYASAMPARASSMAASRHRNAGVRRRETQRRPGARVVPRELSGAVVEQAEQDLRVACIAQPGMFTCAVEAQHDVLHDDPQDPTWVTVSHRL